MIGNERLVINKTSIVIEQERKRIFIVIMMIIHNKGIIIEETITDTTMLNTEIKLETECIISSTWSRCMRHTTRKWCNYTMDRMGCRCQNLQYFHQRVSQCSRLLCSRTCSHRCLKCRCFQCRVCKCHYFQWQSHHSGIQCSRTLLTITQTTHNDTLLFICCQV